MLTFAFIQTVLGLVQGPLAKILDAHIADAELKHKLAAEIETQLMTQLSKADELGAGVVQAEVKSEHWLTRSWRPLLMLLLMAFLVLVGFLLPVADLILGHHVKFEPRWQLLPPEFWPFLQIGMGGYIGGRTLEKLADRAFPGKTSGGIRRKLPDGR